MMTDRRREFWSRYEIPRSGAQLGSGRYGSVYRAIDHVSGDLVAIKKVTMEDLDRGIPSTSLREVTVLRLMQDSPHIINLREAFYDFDRATGSRELNLVFDYMSCDLKYYIFTHKTSLNTRIFKRFMRQLLEGTHSMHCSGIFHRDLKPHNLLVKNADFEEPDLKIADLGLARMHSVPIRSLTHEIGSLHYRAPEVLLGCQYYSHAVDIWSIGCIFAELLTGKTLFPGSSEFSQLIHIFQVLGTPDRQSWPLSTYLKDWHEFPQWSENLLHSSLPDIDPMALDLITGLLTVNPDDRMTVTEALNHPYFASEFGDASTSVKKNKNSSGTSSAGTENRYVN